ncbi:MAG: MMPL family transporter [Pirellulaceae bacterium]|nr:MMPL family transporter [Pirellulaceae bacterium]
MPRLPEGGGFRNTARRAVIGKLAHESHEPIQQMRLLYSDDNEECWRISGRIAGAVTTDYEKLLADVQAMVTEYQTEYQAEYPAGRELAKLSELTIDISGGVPFLYRTQRQLLADLLASFSTAFLMIAASMALLFRSISGGLLTMLPNVTPAAIVFGLMGWFGLEVEIGTVLTASVMMGVCVDDTLHLISHFRAFRAQGLTQSEAVNEALNNCGGAMIQTGLVCGLGMLIFALSPFVPVARFAWLTFALLMVGVASDILLTPAMLLSPLHHLFYWKTLKPALATDAPSPTLATPTLATPVFTAPTPTKPTSSSTPEPVALPEAES